MKYKGDWVNDKPTGKGTFTKQDGSKYAADDAKEISKEALPVKKKVVKKKGREMRWAIHIGSYLSRGEAERVAKMIRLVGDNTYITEHDEGGKHWYRVRVGFLPVTEGSGEPLAGAFGKIYITRAMGRTSHQGGGHVS